MKPSTLVVQGFRLAISTSDRPDRLGRPWLKPRREFFGQFGAQEADLDPMALQRGRCPTAEFEQHK